MSRVIDDIGYTNSDGIRAVCRVSLMTYDILTLKELGHYVEYH